MRPARSCTLLALLVVFAAPGCRSGDAPAPTASTPVAEPPYNAPQSVSGSFALVGGYRLQAEFASEGLALVRDAEGFVVEAIAGANAQTSTLNLYDLRVAPGAGSDVTSYPVLQPIRQWPVAELLPGMPVGQNLRDVAIVNTSAGYEVAGIGRVFYNTAPRASTQVTVRALLTTTSSLAAAILGATRVIGVNLPEQEFSGFIKHDTSATDFREIGAGAYDSGQGSVGGLSYAVQQASGVWTRVLTPPSFGDIATPRLPRDAGYSCPDGASWVCIPPVAGVGVWSTERIGGGGVRYGDNVLFIPMLGYGPRSYDRQTYTFGNPALDQATAYFFRRDASGALQFQRYDKWVYANAGEPVLGVALGRRRGSSDLLLYVVKSMAWKAGVYQDGSVLQVFRIVR